MSLLSYCLIQCSAKIYLIFCAITSTMHKSFVLCLNVFGIKKAVSSQIRQDVWIHLCLIN